MSYVEFPIETDPDELAQDAYDYLSERIDGWVPADGNLEVVLIGAFAQIAAEVRDVAAVVPDDIFRRFGELVGIPPNDATPATVASTWTVIDTAGYTIPAGTVVKIAGPDNTEVGFQTTEDVVIAPGAAATATGEVELAAVDEGAAGSGLTGPAELVDALSYVDTITLVGQTTDGVDAETTTNYLNRLSEELELLAPRPILPRDFAVLARRVAGVDRSTAIAGYNPADGTFDNERTVAVANLDPAGEPVSSTIKATVMALLTALREANFIVHVIDATYTDVDVDFAARAIESFDPADVQARARQAVTDQLTPANWGQPDAGDTRQWINRPVVRRSEITQTLSNVEGLDYLEGLTINGSTAETIALTGVAPLTRPGDITGTVLAPA